MKWFRVPLVLMSLGLLTIPAPAGILFGKKTKPSPAERVPELIVIVKTDTDESKRAAAAKELRQYDPAAFKDIVPVLIDVLMNDAKASVRSEAADSLGDIRPVSKEAGWALEEARQKDASMRVRLAARYSLMQYHWHGYEGQTHDEKVTGPIIKDPPPPGKGVMMSPGDPKAQPVANQSSSWLPSWLTPWNKTTPAPTPPPAVQVVPAKPGIGQSEPPPLADPGQKSTPPAPATSSVPKPLPPGPPKSATPPLPSLESGPTLSPPPG
jgi:HEAT repeats